MSDDYQKLMKLLDEGYVIVCYVDYDYDTGGRREIHRDVAKAKIKSERYNYNSPNYGYVVEARGIRYLDWDKRMLKVDKTFESECERLRLQFIDI